MRTILVAGAAALLLGGTSLTPAVAGGFWSLGKVIHDCYDEATGHNDAIVAWCASNSIDDEGRSNDGNVQRIKQDLDYRGHNVDEDDLEDSRIIGLARNNVEEGDDNHQYIKQDIYVSEDGDHGYADVYNDGVVALAVASNNVEDGDENSQSIVQTGSVIIDYED
jgi:hypothetical protein